MLNGRNLRYVCTSTYAHQASGSGGAGLLLSEQEPIRVRPMLCRLDAEWRCHREVSFGVSSLTASQPGHRSPL